MKKVNLSKFARNVGFMLKKHSPEILIGMGIAGMVTTIVMAVRATPKAMERIDEISYDENDKCFVETTKLEKVKAAWTCYIPTAITGGLSIACIIGASSVNLHRNAALATAYTLSETALREYREKAVELIGEKKEQTIRDEVAKGKIQNDPVSKKEVVITGDGDALCYDTISGRYFKSTAEKLRRVENNLNRRMRDEMYISLNDFYYEIGLGEIKMGYGLGWNVDKGYIDLDFSSQLTEDNRPCLVVDYKVAPIYDYHRY